MPPRTGSSTNVWQWVSFCAFRGFVALLVAVGVWPAVPGSGRSGLIPAPVTAGV